MEGGDLMALSSPQGHSIHNQVDLLVTRLKRRHVLLIGSFACAHDTLLLMRTIISQGRWSSTRSLLTLLRQVGRRLEQAQPIELSVGNVVRRVLHVIKEEHQEVMRQVGQQTTGTQDVMVVVYHKSRCNLSLVERETRVLHCTESHIAVDENEAATTTTTTVPPSHMYRLLGQDSQDVSQQDYDRLHMVHVLKPLFVQAINELLDEFKGLYTNISNQAIEHIHNNEIIMVSGKSRTVENFVQAAHRKRKFQVIVAETAPVYSGQDLAITLAKSGIDTTLIPDSAIYAVMSRVNKVLLGCHAVMANGGLIASSGIHLIAAAAKFHHVPVVVCTGLFKLSPLQPYDEDSLNLLVRPDPVLRFEEEMMDDVEVVNPFFDYIGPEFINLFVSNMGGHPPSYIYRLLSESYDPEDYRLEDGMATMPLPVSMPSDDRPNTSSSSSSSFLVNSCDD